LWEHFSATILKHSQTSVLIDQRCRLIIIISKCVSTHVVCGCRLTLPSALAYTRTHKLSHSLSLRVSVFISFHIKTHLPQMSIIIEIQDSIVFGCSHFIKVALIRNLPFLSYSFQFCLSLQSLSFCSFHFLFPISPYPLFRSFCTSLSQSTPLCP